MNKTITFLALLVFGISRAQVTADFENFSLSADSFYNDTTGADWQTTNASFEYDWTTSSFGDFWSGGFAYTNKNNVDSGNYRHEYNCIAGKGYNLSNYYVTGQPFGIIRVKTPSTGVVGFYVTNTTYAYKSMKNGDSFAKKFGGPTGNDPDWFKLLVKGYSGGSMKPDSVEFYLADFRFSNNSFDYILNSWQWVDCNKLGAVDSVTFFLSSSDNGSFGMNTPAFFSIDNFTTGQGVGINEATSFQDLSIFPNPASNSVNIRLNSNENIPVTVSVFNTLGVLVQNENINFNSGYNTHYLDLQKTESGMYFIELKSDSKTQTIKLIKN